MPGLQTAEVQCPSCWEIVEVVVDCSLDEQSYTEDCSVCCRPMIIVVTASQGEVVTIEARHEDD